MTLHEIEETLHTLESRHPGLNEVMLVTLLRAGGWDDRHVEEARILFRSNVTGSEKTEKVMENPVRVEQGALPTLQEEPVFEPLVDEKHLLPEGDTVGVTDVQKTEPTPTPVSLVASNVSPVVAEERQSLVIELKPYAHPKKDELPHNLPLRPFETSEHVWPFSRYRDVFFGEDAEQPHLVEETPPRVEVVAPVVPSVSQVIVTEPAQVQSEVPKENDDVTLDRMFKRELDPAPVFIQQTVSRQMHGEEKLVVTACVMLLVILMLLGYMYSNGRL